jgi:ornithine carbamoyltransferase
VKNFLDLADLSVDKIESLVDQAKWLEKRGSLPNLQGKVLALLFLNPSLRTLTSLQATMTRLGGGTFVVSPYLLLRLMQMPLVFVPSLAESLCRRISMIAILKN